ncbi:MAG: hypothetical protein V3U75_12375 [Methylococcaceae bacterium]
MRCLNCYRSLVLVICLFVFQVQAKPLLPEEVPEPLKPWVDWVLQDKTDIFCPVNFKATKQKHCSWPSYLTLQLEPIKSTFSSRWLVFADNWITLPGDTKHWPQQVTINEKPVAVIERQGRPTLFLKKGNYQITGNFIWDHIPDHLTIPENTGIIELTLQGKTITTPAIKGSQLWLKDKAQSQFNNKNQQNKLSLHVYRRIIDDIPMQVLTHLEIEISGKQRDIHLGNPLLEGFVPMNLDSRLPVSLEADGRLLLQAKPGRWQIELLARHPKPVSKLVLRPNTKEWPETEIWSFDAKPYQRVVEISDAKVIDPNLTNLPKAWKKLPAYQLLSGEALVFKVIRRGDSEPGPNQLTLNRSLWLDFAGTGYTIRDQIKGIITNGWRLNIQPGMQPGQVTIDEENQLLTQVPASNDIGVELRKGLVNLTADSRFEQSISELNAVGWKQDFNRVEATLNLPPGWRLLAASGVDNIPDTWFYRWTLLDLFVVLIIALSVSRLWHIGWGLLTLITFALIWYEPGAPRYIWLNILAATALLRVLPDNKFALLIKVYRNLSWIGLLVIAIPFMVNQVRTALYPQLEKPWQQIRPMSNLNQGTDFNEELLGSSKDSIQSESYGARSMAKVSPTIKKTLRYAKKQLDNVERTDPNANIQTGPGLPQWQWTKVKLSWNGPVSNEQQIKLWYLTPSMTMVLNFIRIIALSILVLMMSGLAGKLRFNRKVIDTPLLLMGLFVMSSFPIQEAHAEYPNQTLLDTLQKRLLEPPECHPRCAEMSRMSVNINETTLKIQLELHSEHNVAVPLPAIAGQWLPNQINLDGEPASALFRSQEGNLWLNVPQGIHQILLLGKVPAASQFSVPMVLKPHLVEHDETGWSIEGIHEHGQVDNQLQFSRIHSGTTANNLKTELEAVALPPYFFVERTLYLGLDWRVVTQVKRVTPADSPIIKKIPLLQGEKVLSAGVRVKNNEVLVNMPANRTSLQWESALKKQANLVLTAPKTNDWSEVWRVDVSPIWHLTSEGLTVVYQQNNQQRWLPEWRPWPGEIVTLNITRPEGVQGQTMTIDHSELLVKPGKRSRDVTLQYNLRSSQGGKHLVRIPPNSQLQSVSMDEVTQPIRQMERQVTIPIHPGKQSIKLNWRDSAAIDTVISTPAVDMETASVNHQIKVRLGHDRWVLWLSGPQLGPAVLFWGVVLVLFLLSAAMGLISFTPLKSWHWFLLFIGLSQVAIEPALLVIAWIIVLGIKQRDLITNTTMFNLAQVGIVVLTLLSLIVLIMAVQNGLLGSPNMQIAGNQSTPYQLNWFQDRSDAVLPTATIVSVPVVIYRILMLLWSLWLAASLLSWLKWGWECFATGGIWKSAAKQDKSSKVDNIKAS